MKRAFAVLMLAALSLALLASCAEDQIPSSTTGGLVGTWDWTVAGLTTEGYYVFNADGTGNFGLEGMRTQFRWGTRDGAIYMCMTTSACGDTCEAPERMPYTLSGDTLTVNFQGTQYTYTRGN